MKKTDLGRINYPERICGSDKAFVRRIINHVRDFINVNNLNKIVIACSGGLDSICLADICKQVSIINGTDFRIAYVNHGLRPDENKKEIELINSLSLPNSILLGGVEQGANLEARAREVRYFVLKSFCNSFGYNCLFVAHNADEDLETMIMRLADNKYIREETFGAFQRIAYGIKPHSIINDLSIYRPLLSFTKEDLRRYNTIMGIKWLEDSSNALLQYKRNIIRHKIMPLLKSLGKQ